MRTTGKRFYAFILTFALLITMIPLTGTPVYAENATGVTIDGITYDIYDDGGTGSIWITGYTGGGTQLVLPSSITYNNVTYAAPAFEFIIHREAFAGNTSITKIAIPDGYDIMRGAFSGCTGLTEVAIASSVPSIGYWDGGDGSSTNGAFTGCENLKTYRINGDKTTESLEHSGIGQAPDGSLYSGVTVYTKEGSAVDTYIKGLNEASTNGNTITLVYEEDPYKGHTVTPEETTPAPSEPGTGGNDGATSHSEVTPSDPAAAPAAEIDKENASASTEIAPASETSSDKDADVSASLEKGATEAAVSKALIFYKAEKDPKGTVFNLVQLKASKVKKNAITIKWKKVPGAKRYIIFGNKCGKTNGLAKLKSVTSTSAKFTKVNKVKVKKGTYYKFVVAALDKNGKVVSTSKMIHVVTPGGKYCNDKKVTVKKKSVSLKKGKKYKLGAKAVKADNTKKVKKHRGLSYESSDKSIATVSSKGVVKAKSKGKCYIYAYAQNGKFAKVTINVK